jgi:hypothetical protein
MRKVYDCSKNDSPKNSARLGEAMLSEDSLGFLGKEKYQKHLHKKEFSFFKIPGLFSGNCDSVSRAVDPLSFRFCFDHSP